MSIWAGEDYSGDAAVSLETLVQASEALVEILDPIIDEIPDTRLQAIADSAWYRLGSVNVMIRDEGGGALAAALARGLIEQAAYWDWALSTGVGAHHLDQWAALELHGLAELAAEVKDTTWLGWLLPPGTSVAGSAGPAIPTNPGDAVRRLGSGLDAVRPGPLRFNGLLSAYRILDVLAHGNYVGAAILADQDDLKLPERLAAIAIHLAAAGATAVAFALVNDQARVEAATTQFGIVAQKACRIHQLPAQTSAVSRRPPHPKETQAISATSAIEQMPSATADMTSVGLGFMAAVDNLAMVVASERVVVEDGGAWIAQQSFLLSLSSLSVMRGALDGRLAPVLLPISARALFEDGARWNWLRHSASTEAPGESLKALVNEGVRRRDRIGSILESDGVPQKLIDELLGRAKEIPDSDPGDVATPPLDEMLTLAYPNPSGLDSARPMYSVLSQFVHATPISNLHICRDIHPTVSAPVYAIAIEAAARGFERTASVTLLLGGVDSQVLEAPIEELRRRCAAIMLRAASYHFLG
jgi:hypothetical protein